MIAGSGRRLAELERHVASTEATNRGPRHLGETRRVRMSLMLGGPAGLSAADRERARCDSECWPSMRAAARLLGWVYGLSRAEAMAEAGRWLAGMRVALDSPDLPVPPALSLVDAMTVSAVDPTSPKAVQTPHPVAEPPVLEQRIDAFVADALTPRPARPDGARCPHRGRDGRPWVPDQQLVCSRPSVR